MGELAAAGLQEWEAPATAAYADGGSQQRLQAFIVCSMLDLHFQIQAAKTRSEERPLKDGFERLKSAGYVLASLMKSGLHE